MTGSAPCGAACRGQVSSARHGDTWKRRTIVAISGSTLSTSRPGRPNGRGVETTGDAVVLTGTLSDGSAAGPEWQATFAPTERGVLLEAEIGSSEEATSLAFWSSRAQDAAVHGFGEQFTDFNLDGRLLPIIAREQGVGRGEQPLTALADLTKRCGRNRGDDVCRLACG